MRTCPRLHTPPQSTKVDDAGVEAPDDKSAAGAGDSGSFAAVSRAAGEQSSGERELSAPTRTVPGGKTEKSCSAENAFGQRFGLYLLSAFRAFPTKLWVLFGLSLLSAFRTFPTKLWVLFGLSLGAFRAFPKKLWVRFGLSLLSALQAYPTTQRGDVSGLPRTSSERGYAAPTAAWRASGSRTSSPSGAFLNSNDQRRSSSGTSEVGAGCRGIRSAADRRTYRRVCDRRGRSHAALVTTALACV